MSNCSTEKAVPSDPQMTAAAMPVSPAAQENEPALIDRDQHYKIKKLGFKASNEEAKTLLETAVKLDNAVARTDNKMLALGKGKSKHEYKKENKGKPEKEVAYSESTALGHKRVSVIARSYLWPIVEFLRGGEQAEEPEQTADTIK